MIVCVYPQVHGGEGVTAPPVVSGERGGPHHADQATGSPQTFLDCQKPEAGDRLRAVGASFWGGA